ncbi:hypothetical protein, partial [Cellulomonas shaoxiangyii]
MGTTARTADGHVAPGAAPDGRTVLGAPRPPVDRPRCVAALGSAVEVHRVLVVDAPAGFGKTTLVTQWSSARGGPVVRVSLDAFHDDPVRLLRTLAGAVARAYPDTGGTGAVRSAGAGPGAQLDAVAELLGSLPAGTPVVLDDVHHVTSAAGRDALTAVLGARGPRFVLLGRAVRGLALGPGRVEGDVGDLGPATLALTPQETGDLVRAWGPGPDAAAVQDLWRVTLGWPVAVRAALRAGLLHRGRPQRALRPEDVPLTDYVREEVLGTLPPALADFVRRACVAQVVDPVLAEALVPGGAQLLDECVARGFVVRTPALAEAPAEPVWHAVLAAHVRVLVARTRPGTTRAVHRVVARHLASSDPASAIVHAVEGRAPDVAAQVLAGQWPELLVRDQLGAAQRLCAALAGSGADAPGPSPATAVVRALRSGGPAGAVDPVAAVVVAALMPAGG